MNYYIIGLGNPGEKYKDTRHNIGFMVCDYLASRSPGVEFARNKYAQAETATLDLDGHQLTLLKPQTFMNNSGQTVRHLVNKQDTESDTEILIVHDDVDLPLGQLRIAFGRGSGGHRGVQSIIDAVGNNKFARLRVGISPTDNSGEVDKVKDESGVNSFVMSAFSPEEETELERVYPTAKEMITTWVETDPHTAMNRFH